MGVGEELPARRHHERHPQQPPPRRHPPRAEGKRPPQSSSIDCVGRRRLRRARLEAYKGGSFGAEAEAAHRTALARVEAAEAEAEAEREREQVAALGRRREEEPPPPPRRAQAATSRPGAIGPIVRTTPGPIARTTPNPIVRTTPNRLPDQPPPQYPYQQIPPPPRATPRRVSGGTHYGFPPYGMGPGIGPMNPMNPMNPMHPMGMGGYPPYGGVGGPYYGMGAPYGADRSLVAVAAATRGDGRRREPPATPDYAAAKLRTQVDELQKSLASLLDVAKRGGGGIGGGRGGDDDVGARGSERSGSSSLPEEIKDDAEIKKLYAQHLREMLKLQLNIGRESRVVELERLRTEMVQLKDGIVPLRRAEAETQQPCSVPAVPAASSGVLSARVPALRTEPRRASVPAAATATAVPEPSLRRVSGRGPRGRFGTRGTRGGGGHDRTRVRSRGVARAGPRPPTRASLSRKRALRRSPIASFQDERAERARAHARGGIAPGRRRRGRGSRSRGGRRRRQRILGGERQRVRAQRLVLQRRRLVLQRRLARALATGSRAGRPSRHGSGDDGRRRPDGPEGFARGDSWRRCARATNPRETPPGGAVRARGAAHGTILARSRGCRAVQVAREGVPSRVAVTAATKLVLELHAAQPPDRNDAFGGGGAPGPEEVVAWAHIPVLGADGEPPSGLQVTPLLQLPLMLSAEHRAVGGEQGGGSRVGRAGESRPRSDASGNASARKRDRRGRTRRRQKRRRRRRRARLARRRRRGGGGRGGEQEGGRPGGSSPRVARGATRRRGRRRRDGRCVSDGGRSGVLRRRRSVPSPERHHHADRGSRHLRRRSAGARVYPPRSARLAGGVFAAVPRAATIRHRAMEQRHRRGASPDRDHREGHVATAHRGIRRVSLLRRSGDGRAAREHRGARLSPQGGGMAGARVRRHGERGERVQPRRGSVPSEDSLRVDARARARRDASRDPPNKAVPNYEGPASFTAAGCIPRTSSGGCTRTGWRNPVLPFARRCSTSPGKRSRPTFCRG